MMKLKKALAEKEKDLEKAVESNQALNNRLKMLSGERLEERTRSSQAIRALDEEKKMITKKLESLEEAFKVDKVNLLNQIQQVSFQVVCCLHRGVGHSVFLFYSWRSYVLLLG